MPAAAARSSEPSRPAAAPVALVGPEVEENLSLRYLAASLERAGILCDLFGYNGSTDLPVLLSALCAEPQPRLVALSLSFQWRALDVLALAVALRERGFRGHITAGGHFASFAWQELLGDFPELDSICRFEAEDALHELAVAVLAREPSPGPPAWSDIAGIAYRAEDAAPALSPARPPPTLGSLPWPDRRGPAAHCLGHAIAPMIGSRGCYGNCSFCCIATLHRMSSPRDRHRLRDVDDIAAEMAELQAKRGTEIFIFHDDNFFLPRHDESLARVLALGKALEARGLRRFATVVKARPNDVTPEVMGTMRDRVGLVRLFLGVESSTQQGCRTLGRGVQAGEAERALGMLERLGLYVCFNLLVFDPDASTQALLANMEFMQAHGEHPSNFGRVELYAGTPLLARLLAEGRARGDYVAWTYDQSTPEMERVFQLAMAAFYERNFSGWALANRLQSTRFDVEVARFFHPARFRPVWLEAAKDLNRRLACDSAAGVRRIVAHVQSRSPVSADPDFVDELSADLRRCEAEIDAEATALELEVQRTLGLCCDHSPLKDVPVQRGVGPYSRFVASGA
ncbi:MAG: cobalamin-dependent protein [Polyangiaceae bacterium]|nr:cobalamin-dependent protein [Polyangiaceae bacterium]